MSQRLNISIIYAQSPDESVSDREECAAYLYASRAKKSLLAKETDYVASNTTISCIEESSFESIITCEDPKSESGASEDSTILLLIISCSADGSIHRSLRKAAKKAGKKVTSDSTKPIRLAVTLLGHARCQNSAKQMEQTIFGSGRRIEKALLASKSGDEPTFVPIQDKLETQAELLGPEADFDPWWNSVLEKL